MKWNRTMVIAGAELRQLRQSPDFWVPMMVMAWFFFVFAPAVLLYGVTHAGGLSIVQKIGSTLDVLPKAARQAATLQGRTPEARTAYALAVYLFAPLAIMVPMTISTAIGANCLVGEREKGTGEFLAHSPASEREIYVGKLVAAILPGYVTTMIGFTIYALVVNILVGPYVGGWFFPTGNWTLLMFFVVPPFLSLTLSVVLVLSARVSSAAAAQQASGLVTLPLIMLSYAQSSGALVGQAASGVVVGVAAWVLAIVGLRRGARAVTRARLLGVDTRP